MPGVSSSERSSVPGFWQSQSGNWVAVEAGAVPVVVWPEAPEQKIVVAMSSTTNILSVFNRCIT